MGTSGPYTPSPNWSGIKTAVTNALNAGPVTDQDAHDLVRDFVDKLREEKDEGLGNLPDDFGRISPNEAAGKLKELLQKFPKASSPPPRARGGVSSGGGGSGGGSGGGGRIGRTGGGGGRKGGSSQRSGSGSVRPAAQRLASFISQVPKVGLRQALIEAGIANVDQLPPDQIALAIADVLATDSNSIVQTELRDALGTVLEKLCDNPTSLEVAEEKLTNSAYDLQTVVQMLFECYIVERFKTFFSEHEAAKHGYDAADKIVNEARVYVASEMALEKAERRDLTAVEWGSAEGAKIVDGILERTIAIYTD
jgi:hypothetical protein